MGLDIDGIDELQEGIKKAVQTGVDEINKGLNRINNPSGTGSDPLPVNCPNCSATLEISPDAKIVKCLYCGSTFDNTKPKTVVDSVFEFVEKQQQASKELKEEERERELEALRAKAEKAKVNAEFKKKGGVISTLIRLAVIAALVYLCYQNWDQVNQIFITALSKLQAFLETL